MTASAGTAGEPECPQEVRAFLEAHPEVRFVDAIFPDLSGIVRGKRLPVEDLEKLYAHGSALPGSSFLLDAMGENHDPCGYGFTDGDPDAMAYPVPGTLARVPWSGEPLGQVLLTFLGDDGAPYRFEPRTVLRRAAEPLARRGLTPMVAFELEFYLIDAALSETGSPRPPISPETGNRDRATQVYGMGDLQSYGPVLHDIARACALQGIPTGPLTAEYAPGQFEINLHHTPDPLAAADRCILFQRIVRNVARQHGYRATFMSKPYPRETGSGMHVHVSLVDGDGRNVFADRADGTCPERLYHALGGLMAATPESMAFFAANPNAYRRFQPNTFVPLQRSWAFENRSVALRIPLAGGQARRIEHRIAGADANPYLALAAILAGLDHGLEHALDPGPAFEGNAGADYDRAVPWRSRRALDRLEAAEILPRYIDPEYLRVFIAARHAELDKFEAEISPTEYEWFLHTQ
jgi:glutamine synthetase